MSKLIELADAYAQSRANNPAPHSASEARAALVAEVEKLEAENAKLRKELDYFYMYMPTDVKNIVRAALGETK